MTTKELPPGIQDFSLNDFIKAYCLTNSENERWHFASPIQKIHQWAESAHASYILIGGSFVSASAYPSDLDLVVVFKNTSIFQKCPESILIGEVRADIQYISEENSELLSAFIFLLGHSKAGKSKGIARINVNTHGPAPSVPLTKPALYDTVIDVYNGRAQILPYTRKGIIIPIHGINTRAPWLNYFSLLASNSGWGFAPFVYGKERVTTLIRQGRREALVEEFRMWLIKVRSYYDGPIAVFSHSLGTYIFAKYLELFDDTKDKFCGVVLAGSILNTQLDWSPHLNSNRISALYNTYSFRDTWVNKMKDGGNYLWKDPLYGKAGYSGFTNTHNRLFQKKLDILNHVNMFEDDAIKRWLDFLEISLKLHDSTREVRDDIDLNMILNNMNN